MSKSARLTFSPTTRDVDAFYLVGMPVHDAFIGFEFADKRCAVVNALELGNFKEYSRCDKIFSLETECKGIPEELQGISKYAWVAAKVLKKIGADSATMGPEAPVGFYKALSEFIDVNISEGVLFPERAVKSQYEQDEIAKANKGCAAAIEWVGNQLRSSTIKDNQLFLPRSTQPLTSEILRRGAVDVLLSHGLAIADEIIIAGGVQGTNPHACGEGLLRPNELVVVDIFQPLTKTGYWGDMTRTFLKGQPSDAQAKLVETVANAQKDAIAAIKVGVDGVDVHKGVQTYFEAQGYETTETPSGYVGFFHGTGHGLGLECHDGNARISTLSQKLGEGEVYTVEPGLYYPEIGGCRIEDNGVVTQDGFKLLSHLGYDWVV